MESSKIAYQHQPYLQYILLQSFSKPFYDTDKRVNLRFQTSVQVFNFTHFNC